MLLAIDQDNDYQWLGAGLRERKARHDSVLACSKKGIFQGGRVVLFFNCHTEWMSEGEFQELLHRFNPQSYH